MTGPMESGRPDIGTVNYLLVSRTIRNLSQSNFAKALAEMPAASPAALRDRQGASYTWAILMDDRIRADEW